MNAEKIETMLKEAGVKNLKEFGYPGVTTESIMQSPVLRAFFDTMLEENEGQRDDIDAVIAKLRAEISAAQEAV